MYAIVLLTKKEGGFEGRGLARKRWLPQDIHTFKAICPIINARLLMSCNCKSTCLEINTGQILSYIYRAILFREGVTFERVHNFVGTGEKMINHITIVSPVSVLLKLCQRYKCTGRC